MDKGRTKLAAKLNYQLVPADSSYQRALEEADRYQQQSQKDGIARFRANGVMAASKRITTAIFQTSLGVFLPVFCRSSVRIRSGSTVSKFINESEDLLTIVCGWDRQAADVAIGKNADNTVIVLHRDCKPANDDVIRLGHFYRAPVVCVDQEALKGLFIKLGFDLLVHG
jgi:hypothetical protein